MLQLKENNIICPGKGAYIFEKTGLHVSNYFFIVCNCQGNVTSFKHYAHMCTVLPIL